jgi:threonine aldolase
LKTAAAEAPEEPRVIIDLRSDTVTRPTAGMRRAMAEAEVGDDVFGDDPTVRRLEERTAHLLGQEEGLFVPSGTMGNQLAVRCHTRPGDEVLIEAGAHVWNYEGGAAAALSGVQLRPVTGPGGGVLRAGDLEPWLHPDDPHHPRSRLVCLENTHNRAGGRILSLAVIEEVQHFTREHGLMLHLDGARLWNASAATGVPLSAYGRLADSVSVCFSKGLGAPVGSVLCGESSWIKLARRERKKLGGAMRQVGILAAGCLYALDHHLERLPEDHANARVLALAIADIPGVSVDVAGVETNIVLFDVAGTGFGAGELVARLEERGVRLVPFAPTLIRAVTHLDVDREGMLTAARALADAVGAGAPRPVAGRSA